MGKVVVKDVLLINHEEESVVKFGVKSPLVKPSFAGGIRNPLLLIAVLF